MSTTPGGGSKKASVEMTLFAGLLFCLLGSLLSSSAAAPQGRMQARSRCPSGAHSQKEGVAWFCYEFYEYPLTFEDAEAACQQSRSGGHLASIVSEAQTQGIGSYLSLVNQDHVDVWIGLHRSQNSNLANGWRWTDGNLSKYTSWHPNEPNNLANKEFCVALVTATTLRDLSSASGEHLSGGALDVQGKPRAYSEASHACRMPDFSPAPSIETFP
ncbi:UNVERIFIED_CONTAM: hypothetical protein K2H54_077787 [Gekko kuhli]